MRTFFCLKTKTNTYKKKIFLNRDIYQIIKRYLVTDLHNSFLNIENIKDIIETNIKLYQITNNVKYRINTEHLCKIIKLVDKYGYYNEYYNEYEKLYKKSCNTIKEGHPILLDAFFSGCDLPQAYSTHKHFTDKVFSDVREIVYLIADTVNSKFGSIRCRNDITPLFAACINTSVPLNAIEFLLSKGANKNHKIKVNGEKIDILSDLYDNISIIGPTRYEKIQELFTKY